MKTIAKTAGNFATFSQISDNSIKFYKGEEYTGISLQLYSYKMIGTGTSWAVGSAIASWVIGGEYAGPLGILAAS